jgi:predicted Zn finger-like uncharacterized protein
MDGMRIVECPVCGRKYRFDESKMSKEKIRVKCRKCENTFLISKGIFQATRPERSPSPQPEEKPSSPPPEDVSAIALVIKKAPNETARLRIASKLMPITRERLSVLTQQLSKPSAVFHLEMTPSEAKNLVEIIESTGTIAEFTPREVSPPKELRGGEKQEKPTRKKWVAAVVLTVLLLTAGGLAFYMVQEARKTRILEKRGIDSVVPKGAFFYLRLKGLEETRQKIQENPIHGEFLLLVERLKALGPVQDFLSRAGEWEKSTGIPFLRPNLMDLIGSDMRVAFYPDDGSGTSHFLLTMKASPEMKLMETLWKWLPFGQVKKSPKRMDQGKIVYAVRPEGVGREFYYYSEGMVYVISTSTDLIQTSTSLASRRIPLGNSLGSVSLLSEKGEKTGIHRLGLFYLGLNNLTESWFRRSAADDCFPLIQSLKRYGDVVGTISYGKGLVIESTVTVNRQILDQPAQTPLGRPPAPNRTLPYVPRSAIVYASNNSLDLAAYSSWLRRETKKGQHASSALDKIFSEIRGKTGVDIEEDILPFFGDELSYAMISSGNGRGIPFPAMQLFLEIKDWSRVEAALQRLLKEPATRSWVEEAGIELMEMTHEGVLITTLRFRGSDMRRFPLSALTPCYAFVDDFLVIGNGPENLKQTVDLSRGRGLSILKDKRFTEMKRLFNDENNGMAYVDLKAISQMVKGFSPQGPLAGADLTESGNQKAQDLQAFLRILETLNYVRSEAEIDGDRVRFLAYVAL